MIVWTRYTPALKNETYVLEFRMAMIDPSMVSLDDHLDPDSNPDLHRAKVSVGINSDFIAKIDVKGLQAGSDYVFAFVGRSIALRSQCYDHNSQHVLTQIPFSILNLQRQEWQGLTCGADQNCSRPK